MWMPSQAQSLAGGRLAGHHSSARLGTASCRRPAAIPVQQSRVTAKTASRQQRPTLSQAGPSAQSSVVLTAPADAQQAGGQLSAAVQSRSVVISIDYTSDAEQALQWAIDYVIKPGEFLARVPEVVLLFMPNHSRYSCPDITLILYR